MSEQKNMAGINVKKYKRSMRNILIHKPMQREFSLMLIGLLMISTFAVGWVIHHTIHDAAFGGQGFQFGKVSPYEILSDVSYQLLVRVSSILFMTLIVVAVFGIFFLHRVAGPVFRFRYTLMRLNDGEIPHAIKLREGDFFIETAVEINRLIRYQQFQNEQKKKTLEKLAKIIAAGPSHAAYHEASELRALLEREPLDKE